MQVMLKQKFRVESARYLPRLPSTHPCSQMHGHGFLITLSLMMDVDPHLGWGMDYNEIQEKVRPFLRLIDHQVLNKVLENPTSENLAIFLYEKIKPVLPGLAQVSISETENSECIYPVHI